MIKNITSLNNDLIKLIHKQLNSTKHELVMIESQKVFDQINKDLYLDYLICTQSWYDLNKKHQYNVNEILIVTQEIIDKLSFTKNNHSPVLFIFNYQIPEFKIEPNHNYVILDNIQDPGNMANIIRTCVALNCNNIFVSKSSVNLLNDKVIRSSVGSIFNLSVIFYDNLTKLMQSLKANYHYQFIASCISEKAIKLSKFKPIFKHGFCLLVGNEGNGLSESAIKLSDYQVFIDINNIDSLNVASAFAILIYWLIYH